MPHNIDSNKQLLQANIINVDKLPHSWMDIEPWRVYVMVSVKCDGYMGRTQITQSCAFCRRPNKNINTAAINAFMKLNCSCYCYCCCVYLCSYLDTSTWCKIVLFCKRVWPNFPCAGTPVLASSQVAPVRFSSWCLRVWRGKLKRKVKYTLSTFSVTCWATSR